MTAAIATAPVGLVGAVAAGKVAIAMGLAARVVVVLTAAAAVEKAPPEAQAELAVVAAVEVKAHQEVQVGPVQSLYRTSQLPAR